MAKRVGVRHIGSSAADQGDADQFGGYAGLSDLFIHVAADQLNSAAADDPMKSGNNPRIEISP
jgi:hypothetical protein